MSRNDQLQRFIFDHSDIRGELIRLEHSYGTVVANGRYPEGIARLLGQFLAAAGLLSATMKFDGVITLQARGEGPLALIMADCTRQHLLRGIAQVNSAPSPATIPLPTLLGGGHLAITVDPAQGERYQGIVPLEADTLAGCLEDYFALSEQLPTRLWLCADGQRAAGLLLQALPVKTQSPEERDLYWQHITTLADTVTDDELLSLDSDTVLTRLFHQEAVRLFEPRDMAFGCTCSESRTADMLVSLGREEVLEIVEEQGEIEIHCQFCHQQYRFSREQAKALFSAPDPTLH